MRWIRKHKLIASLLSLLLVLVIIFVASMTLGTGGNSLSDVINKSNNGISGFFANISSTIKDGASSILSSKSLKAQIDLLEEEKGQLERELQ